MFKVFSALLICVSFSEAFGNRCYRTDVCNELGLYGNCRALPYCREVKRPGHCERVSPLPQQFRQRKDAQDWENICSSQGLEGGCNSLAFAGCGWIDAGVTCSAIQ